MNNLFKTVVSAVTASTLALSTMGIFPVASAAEDKGAVTPTYDEVIAAVESANDYYQSTVKYNQQEYGIPNCFWAKAAYETGNMETYYTTGIESYRKYALAWADDCSWMGHTSTAPASQWTYGYSQTLSDKAVLFGDFQICFQTYIDLYNIEKNETYGATVDSTKIARALEVMGYEADSSVDAYWWWADSLYMVMPVMTKLYKVTGDEKYLDKLYVQFKYAKELMYDGPGGIPTSANGYTTSAKLSNGASYSDPDNYAYLFFRDAGYVYPLNANPGHESEKNFWARGDGWVFAGLAKVLQDMPDDYEHYDEFETTYLEMAPAIRDCMRTDSNGYGFWTQSMLQGYPTSNSNPDGYETTGTAFFVYGFAWGINSGLLPEDEYLETTIRAWNYLEHVALQDNGLVGYCQYIGSNATVAMEKSSTQNFGVGAFLLAGCEVSRLVGGVQGDMQPYLQKKLQGYMALRVGSPHYYYDSAVGHVFEDDHNTTVYLKEAEGGYATAMLPARPIVEKFGGTVEWDEAAQTVTAKIGDRTVVFTVGSTEILVNGEAMEAPVETEITNSRTFVPIRALCESLGLKVYWNDCGDSTKGVIVIGEKAKPFYDCDYNMVLMLQELLGTNRADGHEFPARPEQEAKSFEPAYQETLSSPVGEKINITAANCTFNQEPEAANPGKNVVDGNSGTFWSSQGTGTVVVDLLQSTPISCVGIQFRQYDDDRTIPYTVYISSDNSSWTTVASGSSKARSNAFIYTAVGKDARYIKYQFDGNSVSGWNSIAEISAYTGDASLVADLTTATAATTTTTSASTSTSATGTKVSISSSNITVSQTPESQNPGANAVDGNSSTVWASQGSANAVIDLGSAMDVTCVGVQFMQYGDSRTIPFSVAVSADNSSYTTVYSGNSVPSSGDMIYVNVNQNARYIKVGVEGNTVSGWSSVAELAVYTGDISAAATTTTSTATTTATVATTTSATATGTKMSISAANCTFSQQPEAANPGANAFDGNSSTLWSSQNQADVVIDLGATTGITCVGVQFKVYEDNRTIPYSIYVSDDKSTWTQVFNGSSTAYSGSTGYATVNQNARYVKVQFEGNTVSGWSSVTEIEVYSGTVAATAATATSTATSSSFTNLSSVSGNFVLNVQGTSNVLTVGSDGTLSVASYVSGNANQIWTKVGNVVTNTGTGQALDVYNESYESGSEVGVWEANGGSNQNWSFVNKTSYYLIQSSMSSLYLTVSSSGQMQQKGESSATKWIVAKAS